MIKETRILILSENEADDSNLQPEFGLSMWIEADDFRILFDTGQGEAFFYNAEALGIPLDKTDAVVLSHGHYDHSGGLTLLWEIAPSLPLYLHPAAPHPKFSASGGNPHPNGMSLENRKAVSERKTQCVWCEKDRIIRSGIGVTGFIPRETQFENNVGLFYQDEECTIKDNIPDDQALWIETEHGVVVLCGCGHAGLINTINHVLNLSGKSLLGVIGGFHLAKAGDRRINATVEALKKIRPAILAPCHCTGEKAVSRFRESFPGALRECHAGAEFHF